MALLERVSTLLRANLNDLLDKAENPEKLAKQVLLDMENQLLQVKTQVAIAIADQHRLFKQRTEHEDAQAQWRRKAELAIAKGHEDLARTALERSLSHAHLAEGFAHQHAEQEADAATLRAAYGNLQGKLADTRGRLELLVSRHRRNRTLAKASPEQSLAAAARSSAQLSRLVSSVASEESAAQVSRTVNALLAAQNVEDRFQSLEQDDRIEALLLELKQRQPQLPS